MIAIDLHPIDLTWLYSLIGVIAWLTLVTTFIISISTNPQRDKPQTPYEYTTPEVGRSKTIGKQITFISRHINDEAFLQSLIQTKVFSVSTREPEHEDEISLEKGDELVVHYVFSDGWAFGVNLSQADVEGMFPLCVCMIK